MDGSLQRLDTLEFAALVGAAQVPIGGVHAPPVLGVGVPCVLGIRHMKTRGMLLLKRPHVRNGRKNVEVALQASIPGKAATRLQHLAGIGHAVCTLGKRFQKPCDKHLVDTGENIDLQARLERKPLQTGTQAARILDDRADLEQIAYGVFALLHPLAHRGHAIGLIAHSYMRFQAMHGGRVLIRGRREQHVRRQVLQRIALGKRTGKAGAARNEGGQTALGIIAAEQAGKLLGAIVQKRCAGTAQDKARRSVVWRRAAKGRREHAKLDVLFCCRGRHARRELAHAVFGREEHLVLAQRIAHGIGVGRSQLVCQQRQIVGLEVIGIQLDIGQPIALHRAAGTRAVQQDIARGVPARDHALGFKHHAVVRLHKAHRAREIALCRHHAIHGAGTVKALARKLFKALGKLAIGIVPNHHTAHAKVRQRLQKALFELVYHINLWHPASLSIKVGNSVRIRNNSSKSSTAFSSR